jgi:hypothetical protein
MCAYIYMYLVCSVRVILYLPFVFLHLVSNFPRCALCISLTALIMLLCVGCICICFSDMLFNCPLTPHMCFHFCLPVSVLTAIETVYFDRELYCTVIDIQFALCFYLHISVLFFLYAMLLLITCLNLSLSLSSATHISERCLLRGYRQKYWRGGAGRI